MRKIKVIYNVNLIANIKDAHWARSGVFFAAACLLKEFARRDDIELVLYYETDNNKLAIKNLKYWCEFLPKCIVKKEALSQKAIIKTVIKKIIGQKCTSLLKKFLARRIKASKNISVVSSAQKVFYLAPAYEFRNDFMKDANICKFSIAHDVMPLVFPQYYPNSQEGWLESFKMFDNYFANSAYTKTDFLKHLPHLKPENIIVTPLACDERFKPANADEIARARNKYNIPENKKYIFSLCTLEPRKNLIRAVKCFANFISKNNIDDLVFVLGGAHWDAFIEKLENEIGSLDENIKSKILKIGYVDDSDQAALYSGALFFVYTSAYEGFGLPPLEAMSCGTPVITSNNSSLPEVVGSAGIMIDYDDDEAHIKAYESYYYNENLRQENSKKGLEQAKLFSWEKCADIMITEMKRRALNV